MAPRYHLPVLLSFHLPVNKKQPSTAVIHLRITNDLNGMQPATKSTPANPHFTYVDETNKKSYRPSASANRVCLSRLKNVCVPTSAGNFAIKYVIRGTEYYRIDKKLYEVQEQFFLFTRPKIPGTVMIESKVEVDGICIDIDYNTMAEAYTILSMKGKIDLDNNLCHYFKSPEFFDNIYPAAYSSLATPVSFFAKHFNNGTAPDDTELNEEWFFALAERAVMHENENLKGMNSLSCVKNTTRKEILRRLMMAKYFMEENFRLPLKIKEIAEAGLMSEFHFFRSFKEAFGITPHRFLLKKRLNAAYHQLKSAETSVGDAAAGNGFSDIYSFSKTFRKHYGIAPSEVSFARS